MSIKWIILTIYMFIEMYSSDQYCFEGTTGQLTVLFGAMDDPYTDQATFTLTDCVNKDINVGKLYCHVTCFEKALMQ